MNRFCELFRAVEGRLSKASGRVLFYFELIAVGVGVLGLFNKQFLVAIGFLLLAIYLHLKGES